MSRRPDSSGCGLVVVAILIAISTLASATGHCEERPKWKRSLLVQSLGAGADLASTEIALNRPGTQEANLLMRGPFAKRAAIKAGQVAVTTWGAHELRKKGHHGWARAVDIAVPALNFLIAAHNMRQGK